MDDTITGFRLRYADGLTFCMAIMHETCYEVFFNRRPVAELVMNDDMEWMLSAGVVLPDEIVAIIGRAIESKYR